MQNKISRQLIESYRKDSPPFITSKVSFPEGAIESSKVISLLKEIFFPNYFNSDDSFLDINIEELKSIIYEGMKAYNPKLQEKDTRNKANDIIESLADIRETLKTDIEAAFSGDPAAGDYTQIIRAYPGFLAIMMHRFAHEIYKAGEKGFAREIQETTAHTKTGIDIHPGAKIGTHFFIDHGTGVVIGETAEIGNWTRLYQGVTLGVLHFEKEDGGVLKKGYKRHPSIGNHVVIGAGANVLGPITIGDHVNIGAGSIIVEDTASHTTIYKKRPEHVTKERKNN